MLVPELSLLAMRIRVECSRHDIGINDVILYRDLELKNAVKIGGSTNVYVILSGIVSAPNVHLLGELLIDIFSLYRVLPGIDVLRLRCRALLEGDDTDHIFLTIWDEQIFKHALASPHYLLPLRLAWYEGNRNFQALGISLHSSDYVMAAEWGLLAHQQVLQEIALNSTGKEKNNVLKAAYFCTISALRFAMSYLGRFFETDAQLLLEIKDLSPSYSPVLLNLVEIMGLSVEDAYKNSAEILSLALELVMKNSVE